MKRSSIIFIVLLAAAFLFLCQFFIIHTSNAQEESPLSKWQFRAPISLNGLGDEPLVEIPLPTEVLNHCKPDLSDIRILHKSTGEETGYVKRTERYSITQKVLLPGTVKNRTYVPNVSSTIVVDFGENKIKDQISIQTPGTNFRRKVLIEGSNDGNTWEHIQQDTFLFRVKTNAIASGIFDKNIIHFSNNDQRYLRVTVYNGHEDPPKIEIGNISVWKTLKEEPKLFNVEIIKFESQEDEKEKLTKINVDLGYNNMPLNQLSIEVDNTDFWRHIEIYGRREKQKRIIIKAEDGTDIEKIVDVSWNYISKGILYRFSSGGKFDQNLSRNLKQTTYRYLQIRVSNFDDPPLKFTGAKVNQFARYIAFRPMKKGDYYLYFGNPQAHNPSYDLGHYVAKLRTEGVFIATLGTSEPVPEFLENASKVESAPWSERYSILLWIALVFGTLLLGYMVLKQVKAPPPASRK